jgi:hypothetical protein
MELVGFLPVCLFGSGFQFNNANYNYTNSNVGSQLCL